MPRVKTEAKERAILDAAAKVFATKPFHGVLIDEIASDAGIGKGTIYRYFETKDDLYFATTLHILDRLAEVLSEALAQERSAARRLERIARENLRFYWDRRFLFPFLETDGIARPARGVAAAARNHPALRAGSDPRRASSSASSGASTPASAPSCSSGLVRSANLFRLPEDTLEDLVAQIMSVFLQGVTRREP